MAFGKVKGQDRAIGFLKGSIRRGKLAHAHLFLGPPGTGRTAAVELAGALNCESPEQAEGEACGECLACRKIARGIHPDVCLIRPEGRGDRIRIEAIRSLQRAIALKPCEGKKKVWILEKAESMTEEAANCLLKTLEEPPVDSYLVLISANPDRLLPTVLSRCQRVVFSSLEPEEVRDILIEEHGLESQFAHFLACFSEGGMERALRLMNEGFCSSLEEKNHTIDSFIAAGPAREEFVESLARRSREEIVLVLELVLSWFRDVLILKSGGKTLINIDRQKDLRRAAMSLGFQRLIEVIEAIGETRGFIQAYANPKLALPVLADKF